jgi:RNA polymerase sigma-70 factor (ECF subfamily)
MDGHSELQDIVDAARSGDADAQAELFDRYHGAVLRYAYARLGSLPDAEDVAAETFLSALRAIPGFRWRGVPFEAWLFRIARSKVVDVARRRTRVRDLHARPTLDDVDASVPDPAAGVESLEHQAELARALDRLPGTQRDVIILRFLLGRSVREVAGQLNRSEGAVKQLQARALVNLRAQLDR